MQSLCYPYSVVTLFSFLELLSWNRKSDVLFTGLSVRSWLGMTSSEKVEKAYFPVFTVGGICAMVCCCDMDFVLSKGFFVLF